MLACSPDRSGTMTDTFLLCFALVAVTAACAVAARRLRVPYSIVLVITGIALAFVPGLPKVELDPQVVMLLFLPPLLYMAGVSMSWRGFRDNLRPIALLAVGCVLFTACTVAAVAHWAIGLPWGIAFILGAVARLTSWHPWRLRGGFRCQRTPARTVPLVPGTHLFGGRTVRSSPARSAGPQRSAYRPPLSGHDFGRSAHLSWVRCAGPVVLVT